MPKKQVTGKVVSDKMDKTVVVEVERVKQHPLYQKRYTVHDKYQVHDPDNEFQAGDQVLIEECRPLSKNKRWRVIKKLS